MKITKTKMNRKIIISLFTTIIFCIFACTPVKNNCGSKKQHKARFNKTKKMAPSMSY